MPTSYQPLDSEKSFGEEEDDPILQRISDRRLRLRDHWRAVCIHIALISVYTLVATLLVSNSSSREIRDPVHTPAKDGTVYQVNSVNVEDNPYKGLYVGNPGSGVDEQWANLLRATNIRVSAEDLAAVNRTSIPLNDGSGDFWASMNVHHHLHCLEMMRHYIAIDYYPHDTEIRKFQMTEGHVYPHHIEHCIEGLRLWLICQPDTHLLTYEWPDEDVVVPDKNHAVTHQCVDWTRLEEWAFERSFSLDDGFIDYPDGRPFPPGRAS